MYPILFHIYGPIAIHSFGCMIALGALICLNLAKRDPFLMKLIPSDELINISGIIFLASFIGGRALYIFEFSDNQYSLWQNIIMGYSGFSILGSVGASVIALVFYLNYKKYEILRILDRLAIYAALLYSISRIGCFFAGCCYGCVTTVPWAVIYSNPQVFAPCNVPLHPTQIYSAIAGFLIFLGLYFKFKKTYTNSPGVITGLFLAFIAQERFVVDFLRANRTMIDSYGFSIMQRWALGIIILGYLFSAMIKVYQKYFKLNK